MERLFDELVAVYGRYERIQLAAAGSREIEKLWDKNQNGDALLELEGVIIKLLAPVTVGQVMALPHVELRERGLTYLIEKDASDHYDQVEGFVDMVLADQLEDMITPAEFGFNGLQLCEWIDQQFPRNDDESVSTSARPERSEDVRGSNIKTSHGG